MTRRALLVGIDTYQAFRPLAGCVNDVAALLPLLSRNEDNSRNFYCQTLANVQRGVTRDELRQGVTRLLAPGAEVALLYAACHGVDRNGTVVLATSDGTRESPGIAITEILDAAAAKGVGEVLIILDCCLSGSAGVVPQLGSDASVLRTGLAMLTATRGDQLAGESTDGRGVFSTMLCGALAGGAADVRGNVSIGGLYAYLSECFGVWDQSPQLKANVTREIIIRRSRPAVPVEDLYELPDLFVTPEYELPLDPSYEPLAEPQHEEHQRVFGLLQRARAAKLVEPVGTDHLYFAAMESKPCRLTPLGRHYRLLAARDLL
ncbi:caspase family protein [Amorphoplanes nipponensis]|uniref:Peptidase C14 caspase domain-containing protein n=1 Tax=Actinoplanes nipponensis TaxID=135950 RepID=A0A919JKG7_9ACTN|nr:caspase family protein [Actinoplanes nipponensis]GIE50995.1 hypothetical protein Ani05nite_45290 [Actinoplanes nipponensis]